MLLGNQELRELGDRSLRHVLSLERCFKYVNFKDGIEHILKDRTLKFSKPKDFNDPFDCNEWMLDIRIDKDQERKIIMEAAKNRGIPRYYIRKHLRKLGGVYQYPNAFKSKKEDIRVSCFSEICDNTLMWSHYADRHNGICIGFDMNILCEDYALYPVNYIEEVQQIDGMSDTPYVFYYWATFKAAQWKYEQEVRAVTSSGKTFIPFPSDSVKEIIFGCNVKSEILFKTVKTLRKLGYSKVEYHKMELEPFNLKLRKVNIKV